MHDVGIIGASGYAGIEATRLLAQHPRVRLSLLASDRWQGEMASARAGISGPAGTLRYEPQADAARLGARCETVLLCTPVEASLALAPALLAGGTRVIDLSGAFRLRDASRFQAAYGLAHPAQHLLAEALYGLPELLEPGDRGQDGGPAHRAARLIANPGCYATAAALALAPLLRAGLLAEEAIVVDAASGTTGAGRKGSEELSFSEVAGDFHAYRVLRHQHVPEMVQTLAAATAAAGSTSSAPESAQRPGLREPRLTFTPHLLPLRRGILATCSARLRAGVGRPEVADAFMHIYASAPFVMRAAQPDAVGLHAVVGTNRCQLGFAVDQSGFDPGRVVVVTSIDNLVKGAAGQAVQNLNLAQGWEETEGLASLRGFHP